MVVVGVGAKIDLFPGGGSGGGRGSDLRVALAGNPAVRDFMAAQTQTNSWRERRCRRHRLALLS